MNECFMTCFGNERHTVQGIDCDIIRRVISIITTNQRHYLMLFNLKGDQSVFQRFYSGRSKHYFHLLLNFYTLSMTYLTFSQAKGFCISFVKVSELSCLWCREKTYEEMKKGNEKENTDFAFRCIPYLRCF